MSSRPLIIALTMLVAGIFLALMADYPVYEQKVKPFHLTFQPGSNRTIGLQSYDGFHPYNSTLKIVSDKNLSIIIVNIESRRSKRLDLKPMQKVSLSYMGAPFLRISAVGGDFPATLECTYVVDGYRKPYLWLGLPSAIIIFAGFILAVKGYIALLSSVIEE